MIIVKASTKKGQDIISRTKYNKGTTLRDVYGKHSGAKQKAYDWCMEQYFLTDNHSNFRITAANTFGFAAAWNGTENNKPILRYETKDNTYLVLLSQ